MPDHSSEHNDTRFTCPQCMKIFKTRKSRAEHLLVAHRAQSKDNRRCPLCDFKGWSVISLCQCSLNNQKNPANSNSIKNRTYLMNRFEL